ncbi:hypothetical protein F4810DRAFT_660746 [Camillea tinctor]|nr:hypothetical protein F4810DRAFT_660746 [Camillea tinctor]
MPSSLLYTWLLQLGLGLNFISHSTLNCLNTTWHRSSFSSFNSFKRLCYVMPNSDVFMSSPPRPANPDPVQIPSSSPNLPSLDEIFTKNPKKKTSFHSGFGVSFSSAAALLRDAPEIDIETEQITHTPPRKAKDSRGRKKIVAPGPASKNDTENPIVIDSPSPKDKPWNKFKSKKPIAQDKQDAAPEIDENKSKPKKPARAKTGTVSRHFTSKEGEIPGRDKGKGKADINHEKPLQGDPGMVGSSEPAMARRNDWTPTKNTISLVVGSDPDTRELHSSMDETAISTSKDVFPNLFDTYGRKNAIPQRSSGQPSQLEILKKRKHIELVSTTNDEGQLPRNVSAPKATKVKKKTRTITELATSRYILPPQPELDLGGPSTEDSLLNYFDEDGALKGLVEHQATVMSMKKDKAKPGKESIKPKRKKKEGTENNPILLSPNSALKQSSNQDFLFGTSSQLVREDSPTILRELQMAIRASNQIDSDPFAEPEPDSQGLWHASARDIDGDLMEIEVIDPEMSPDNLQRSVEEDTSIVETFVDIEDILTSPANANSISTAVIPNRNTSNPVQSQVNKPAQPLESDHTEPAHSAPTAPRPNYELLTDAQLSRQITSYGFKPVKKRQAMIALLDQCWASKNQGPSSIQANSITTSAQPQSPKRTTINDPAASVKVAKPGGHPKKDADAESSAATSIKSPKTSKPRKAPSPKRTSSPKRARSPAKKSRAKTIEIADSDDAEDLDSPASSPSDHMFSSPPPLDLSLIDDESPDADNSLIPPASDDEQTRTFRYITKAVVSAPRSQDPRDPSWHERMLLFDPVVLEDLAAWLNAGELTRVGYDGEVAPQELKRWCESKSVVCLWRTNSRGKERKRF